MSENTSKYVLTLNEDQAKITDKALELYARLRMGQWNELIDLCVDLADEDYCEKRDQLEVALMHDRKIAYPDLSTSIGHSYGVGKFTDGDLAWEVHKVLRHRMAWTEHPEGGLGVDFDKPISFRGNELAQCEVVEEKN